MHIDLLRGATPHHKTPLVALEGRSGLGLTGLLLALLPVLAGCDGLMLSPRQQVVRDAQRAVCEARDIKAMAPFLTEKSQPMIELASSLAGLGQAFGVNTADKIAVGCQDAKTEFLDEVKVSETRYIVRSRTPGKAETTETAVVQDGGRWKISLY